MIIDQNPFKDRPAEDHQLQAFQCVMREGETSVIALTPTADLPVKKLPPGHPKDHWWSFRGTPGCENVGSYSTFKRVWELCFKQILRFRTFGQHACCTECSKLKAAMRAAPSMTQKLQRAKEYREHLRSQWRDRLVYWRMREKSRALDGNWLVVMLDGADQSKFRIVKSTRWPKALDGVHRPHLQLLGCWSHGHEISFNLREEDVPKGSNVIIEVILASLSRILERSTEEGQAMPSHLWVQVDNAVGENKNQHVMRTLALLVDRGIFRSTVLSTLRVGHTHEDLDAVFGIVTRHIRNELSRDTPLTHTQHGEHHPATYGPANETLCRVFNFVAECARLEIMARAPR